MRTVRSLLAGTLAALFLLTLLFRVIGVLRIKTKTDTFRSMMGRTAGWLTAGMLLTLVVHFFLTGVPG